MQVRNGNRADLPESLAEGELGYTKDTGELFIGAPALGSIQWRRTQGSIPGVFPYSNLKILTERDISYTVTGQMYTQGPLLSADLSQNTSSDTEALTIQASTQNCFIFDYSLVAIGDDTDIKPRRIGTMWIISNATECELLDNYTELTVDNPQGSGLSMNAEITYIGGNKPENRFLRILFQNSSGIPYRLHLLGKSWQATND